jgi:hypothetical protein
VTKSTTDPPFTFESIARARRLTREPSHSRNLTEELRRALIERPGEAGALGMTAITREVAERQATQFCQVRSADCVASAVGEFRARVYELADDGWGVVVWFTPAALITK